jgi:hypothetical protein
MNAIRFRRVGAVIFAIASVAWLVETLNEHDGTMSEVAVGALLVVLAAGWLGWEFSGKTSS